MTSKATPKIPTEAELETVDRLLALSSECGKIVIGRALGPIDLSWAQGAALRQAAAILEVDIQTPGGPHELEEDN